MREFEHSLIIEASADAIFDCVANPANLPRFVPSVWSAEWCDRNRIYVHGEENGQQYDVVADFHPDDLEYILEWSVPQPESCQGRLEIEELPSGRCEVTARVIVSAHNQQGGAEQDDIVQQRLMAALQTVRRECESVPACAGSR